MPTKYIYSEEGLVGRKVGRITVGRYIKPSKNVGMRGSAILKHIYDMVEVDGMQIYEIKTMLDKLIDEHVEEADV